VNNTTHPIEFFLAAVLATIESILWIINELAGFHAQPTATATVTATPAQTTPQAPTTRDTRTDNEIYYSLYVKRLMEPVQPILDVARMTKKELQEFTGIKSSRYNKAALLTIAIEKATPAQ
jgi:hypothetical protein